MKKSKIRLQYKVFFILSFIFSIIVIKNNLYFTNYSVTTKTITGIVTSYQYDGDMLKLELKGKEKVIVQYYFKEETEKTTWQKQLSFGDTIKVEGTFSYPKENTNFNLFNYQNYLKSKKIYFQVTANKITYLSQTKNILYLGKQVLWKHLEQFKEEDNLKLFLFGNKDLINPEIIKQYQFCGISHLMAISGMHISLIVTILTIFIGKIKKKRTFIFVASILLYYSFLIDFTPSVMRATLFFLLLKGKSFINNKSSTLEIFLLLTSLFLIYNPYYWYHIGFVFSFLISFTLIWAGDSIKGTYLKKLFLTSLISFIIGLPIVINQFFEVNLLTPIYNLFFVPFVSLLVFPFAFITVIIPFIEPVFHYLITILEVTSNFCMKIPTMIPFRTLTQIELVSAYLILFFILKKWKEKHKCYLLIIPFLLFLHYHSLTISPKENMISIDVGQGDSTLLLSKNTAILIDTGGMVTYTKEPWQKRKKDYSLAQNIIVPYLKSIGVHSLDALFITHGDADHAKETINLINYFRVEKVYFNQFDNELELKIKIKLKEKKIQYQNIAQETIKINHINIHSLNPGNFDNENDNSLILDTKISNMHILLMGDASKITEKSLYAYFNKNVDILKVGHHGSNTSTAKQFLEIIKPQFASISVGLNNRYGHPHNETLKQLKEFRVTYYQTSINGMIKYDLKNNTIHTCH